MIVHKSACSSAGGLFKTKRIKHSRCVLSVQAQAFQHDDAAFNHSSLLQQNELITFFTADGIVQIPGKTYHVPRRLSSTQQRMPTWEEQTLCIGQTFQVAAWSRDPNRRIAWRGFCQSVDLLHDSVEEAVLSRGGEIIGQERHLKSGVHEQLMLTICIPYLFGVPPEIEVLSAAIQHGGGIVDKVYQQWGIYPANSDGKGGYGSYLGPGKNSNGASRFC